MNWLFATTGIALCVAVHAQVPSSKPSDPDPVATAYRELRVMLEASTSHERPRVRRRELLEEFLERHAKAAPQRTEVLTVRCRLGSSSLSDFDHESARRQFDAVLRHAAPSEVDMRGRAKYGLAQAYELAGKPEQAAVQLRRLQHESRGTRYARFAQVALARLASRRKQIIGALAPEFGPRLDLDGKARRLDDLNGKVRCIVFVSATDEPGLREATGWLETCERAGLGSEQITVFAMHTADTSLELLRKRYGIESPIIECEHEFLDTAAMSLRVQELPNLILIGPDGRALARNPSKRRLREALAKLR